MKRRSRYPTIHTTAPTCFYEADPTLALARRALVEAIGTLLLMFAAAGAGLAVLRHAGDAPGIGLIAGAVASPGTLVALILAFGAVSGGHFNPLITALQWLSGERSGRCTVAYVAAQLIGALIGAQLANALFQARREVAAATAHWTWLPTETLAMAGLLIVVFGCARSGRTETGPFAVGAWLCGTAIVAPSAYMNPAVTIGALVAAGPIALSGQSSLSYLPSQIAGALVAFAVIRAAYPASLMERHER